MNSICHAVWISQDYARSKGLHVNFSPYDTTRCNMDFLLRVMEVLHDSGYVDRIRSSIPWVRPHRRQLPTMCGR
jgi:hypothetical protein